MLTRAVVVIVLLFCTALGLVAQSMDAYTGRLEGQIDTQQGSPPANTFVYVHYAVGEETANQNGHIGDIKAPVDNSGRFSVRLSPSAYDVFVAASGYLPECRVIHMEAGKTTKMAFNLKLDLLGATQDSGGSIEVTIEPPATGR